MFRCSSPRLAPKGKKRFTTFFTDNIRNRNTREAYFRAAFQFFDWSDGKGLNFRTIQSFHVSAYIEHLMLDKSKSTVKQHLAAIRMLYDWLVVGQIVEINPAHAVRGPKHVVTTGTTAILDGEQMRQLLDSIDVSTIVGLRDRAIIAVMTATFRSRRSNAWHEYRRLLRRWEMLVDQAQREKRQGQHDARPAQIGRVSGCLH